MTTYFKKLGYRVNKEFTGHWHKTKVKGLKQGQMFVARSMNDFIGTGLTRKKAELLCLFSDDEKTINILNKVK